MKREKGKKLLTLCLSLSMMFSIIYIPTLPAREAKAAGHGIGNPRTDGNGVSTWDCIYFGNYYQSNSEVKEPIKWRVLSVDGDNAFLLADQNLDCQPYNTTQTKVTWETCTLRKWLNNDFCNMAFSAGEQSTIMTTTVVNEKNSEYDVKGGKDTDDKVYLLSVSEAMNPLYGFSSDYEDSGTREAKNTEYAKECGAWFSGYTDYAGNGWWWLRSPGGSLNLMSVVDSEGSADNYGIYVDNSDTAVRPALHLNLSSDQWSKAGTVSASGGDKGKENPVGSSAGNLTVTDTPKTISKTVTAPGKVQKLKAKNSKKKSVALSWKKVSSAKGYQIQYAANKKFKKEKKASKLATKLTAKCTTKTKFTVKKLKKKKTYYFRVRAYKLNGKKKVYGKWSAVKKVKVKR